MGFPEDRLSTVPVSNVWLTPDEIDRSLLEDKEYGPIAIGNTSQGLQYQIWHLVYNPATGAFVATPEITGLPVTLLTLPDITNVSIAFDNAGNVNLSYTQAGLVYLRWFDTQANQYVTSQFDPDIYSSMVCLDDKRYTQTDKADVLFMYTKAINNQYAFYFRKQRDRYTVEYFLNADVPKLVYKLGMHAGLRVQIGFLESDTPAESTYILLESGYHIRLEDDVSRLLKE